jgi:flagellar basal-body rod protein FlgF
MDRMIYLAMSGAKAMEERQTALANNLANATTDAFRADLAAFRSVPIRQEGTATSRVFALEATAGFDASSGPIRQTGRPLDVAIRGSGWFVVQTPAGDEALTRDGAFEVDADGTLVTRRGMPVVGDGGPIAIPPNSQVLVGSDGTISAKTGNQPPVQVGRLRLANPPQDALAKGDDGLVRLNNGEPPVEDPAVTVVDGALEGSNVNVIDSMVGMIQLARQFEMQMQLIKNAETNDQRASRLLGDGN